MRVRPTTSMTLCAITSCGAARAVADVQVNLAPKDEKRRSHDIARRVRPAIRQIAVKFDAHVKVAEAPPCPPGTANACCPTL